MVETFNCDEIDKNNLQKGSKGALVTLLQTHLKALGYYTSYNGHYLKIDGDFGDYTAWALKRFQGATGHSKDAVFGIKTCKTLNEKILALNGIKSTPADTTTTTSTTTTTGTGTTSKTTQADPYKIDTSKNVFGVYETNFHIEGLHFIISSITYNNAFRTGNWKQIELSDAIGFGLFAYKGTKAVTPDLIIYNGSVTSL